MSTESDRLLIQRIKDHPKKSRLYDEAWNELFRRYSGRLGAYVRRRLRDHAAVEDVVQETFIGFVNSLANYDDRRDLQTWLFTIASHKVTDQMRRTGRRPHHAVGEGEEDVFDRSPDAKQRAASSLARSSERRHKEEDALGRALLMIVQEWKARGDYKSIMTLELLFVKGWGNKDVAARVGVSEQQVANIKFQAKKRLHEFICTAKLSPDVFPELRAEPTVGS
jgi:RNA polymerase sigma-70 factor (ECF subfamily)